MTRLFLSFAVFLALAVLGSWLADHQGAVEIAFGDRVLYTRFGVLVGALAALLVAVAASVWGLSLLRRHLPVIGTERAIKRQRRGLDLLNRALVSLSAGDHRMADTLVKDAELLLPPQPMVHLIAAEAALRRGDRQAARSRFQQLEASEDGKLIGLRGLIGDARTGGQAAEALALARRAFETHSKSPWVLKTLFALEVEAGHWGEARTALDRVARQKLLPEDQIQRHRSALFYSEAAALELAGDLTGAASAFAQAEKARPDFAPPVAALARLDRWAGKTARAEKRLMAAWAKAPHPALARAYKDLDVAESGAAWLKRADRLAGRNPGHVESHLVLADAHLDARSAAGAEPLVDALMNEAPDRRAWMLKLRLLTLQGLSTDGAEAALETAKAPPGWVCEDCGSPASLWGPLCSHCGGFDTLVWDGQMALSASSADGGEALMLLTDVGTGPDAVSPDRRGG